ncbi:uncharacterized protein LOC111409736 isoform X3 [Olea europaea var. sylvestris]|uniref:uncharacterized protein LOC111409736 isoform X3 n=1 Tax=Olea europaea var. sylvestris TaxID=158386 RepID=UPI000C1D0B76|nr:uncharacterized protein LOC111409736 isoform X3 [Olea europaea var. sylvestris]
MKRKRLHNREGGLTIEMEEMKEEILDFCDGLPLGVKILAETISIRIARNYDWGIPEKEIILGLDGDDLRSRKITHDQVAQTDEDGFIYIRIYLRGTDSVGQSMEEVGQICFPELISVTPHLLTRGEMRDKLHLYRG